MSSGNSPVRGGGLANEPTAADLHHQQSSANSSPLRPGQISPTTTISTGSSNLNIFEPSLHSALQTQSRSSTSSIATLTATRKVTIRSDPALVTCFDPADKELYDLWAPK